MAIAADRHRAGPIHALHAVLLAGALPLFLGALLSDHAYARTYEIQWSNFASWLLIGAMVLATPVLLWAIADFLRARQRPLYLLLVLATWVVGFFAELHHARDAWAIMPAAPWLSLAATVLAAIATWLGFATLRTRGVR